MCWLIWNGAHSFEALREVLPAWSRESIQYELDALLRLGMIRPASGPELPGCAAYVLTLKGECEMQKLSAVANLQKGPRRTPSIWE